MPRSVHDHGPGASGGQATSFFSSPDSEYATYARSGSAPRMVALNVTSLPRKTVVSPGWTSAPMMVLAAGRLVLEGRMMRSSEAENVFQLMRAEMNATAQQTIAPTATRISNFVLPTSFGCTCVSSFAARLPTALPTSSSAFERTPRRRN